MRRSQSGLALIMVLMIFAVVSVLATVMIDRQSRDIQRAIAQLSTQQARALTFGVESVVRSGLHLDWENDPDIDHAMEEWNIDRQFPMDNGAVLVHIADAQGRFNLNWLSPSASNQSLWQQRFYKLLNDLGLDVEIAERLANWFNSESQVDNDYLGLEVPYRAAYNLCAHTSELMLVEGVDQATYDRLEPYIACLPATTQLNVNTASDLVLASLGTDLTIEDGQTIISERGDEGFTDVDAFMTVDAVKKAATKTTTESDSDSSSDSDSESSSKSGWSNDDFTVKTEYFEIFTQVAYGPGSEWVATAEMLLKRDASSGNFRTIYRDFSRLQARPVAESVSTTQ
ncbi:type II secretion system minor pseudopilin GspK [Oceanobacter mangrovi]|uniref:type II secretion system minor pseudopilin GspK n=1 Tax=Oceanobacter mangrovi TaxID=2862510 RepID=UPI001C8E65C0|nr:type II secretion system minor pseudopilin GspK [Oceanobacter mangrovi]